jgi:hypothetical protein
MRTTILAYAIALMGLLMIVGGLWSLLLTARGSLREYLIHIGIISGGLAMIGLAQALRLLLAISGHG